jgi:hypothetical protein
MLHRIGAAGGLCDGGDCEGDATVERAGLCSPSTSHTISPVTDELEAARRAALRARGRALTMQR